MSRQSLLDLTADLVRDRDQVISAGQYAQALDAAVLRYSGDRPRQLVEDLTSAGGRRLALPTAWENGRSRTISLEYPVGLQPASYIESGTWTLYQGVSQAEIELPLSLSAGELVRLTYTVGHVLSSSTNTIPSSDHRAVAALAASDLCGQLARYYGQESESSISADAVDRRSKADTWRAFERDLRQQYFSQLGITERAGRASGVVVAPARPQERTRIFGRRR